MENFFLNLVEYAIIALILYAFFMGISLMKSKQKPTVSSAADSNTTAAPAVQPTAAATSNDALEGLLARMKGAAPNAGAAATATANKAGTTAKAVFAKTGGWLLTAIASFGKIVAEKILPYLGKVTWKYLSRFFDWLGRVFTGDFGWNITCFATSVVLLFFFVLNKVTDGNMDDDQLKMLAGFAIGLFIASVMMTFSKKVNKETKK